jgi:UDP-glucuronate 4-epimerase
MNYLITGAARFIGSKLCRELANQSNQIVAVDNFTNYYDVNLKKARIKEFLTSPNIKLLT